MILIVRYSLAVLLATLFFAAAAQADIIRVDPNNVATVIGRHFWATGPATKLTCVACAKYSIDFLEEDAGFTVTGVKKVGSISPFVYAQVKADDGKVGDIEVTFGTSWYTDNPKDRHAAEIASINASIAAVKAECQKLPDLRIGMTPPEVAESKWGMASDEHTTQTATHTRIQWVYAHGPHCPDGNGLGRPRYLYFEDGHLTMIER
jgi:hypothetical protein